MEKIPSSQSLWSSRKYLNALKAPQIPRVSSIRGFHSQAVGQVKRQSERAWTVTPIDTEVALRWKTSQASRAIGDVSAARVVSGVLDSTAAAGEAAIKRADFIFMLRPAPPNGSASSSFPMDEVIGESDIKAPNII